MHAAFSTLLKSAAVAGGRLYIAAGSLKPGSGAVTDQLIVFSLP
jgi:hypothetical protein